MPPEKAIDQSRQKGCPAEEGVCQRCQGARGRGGHGGLGAAQSQCHGEVLSGFHADRQSCALQLRLPLLTAPLLPQPLPSFQAYPAHSLLVLTFKPCFHKPQSFLPFLASHGV